MSNGVVFILKRREDFNAEKHTKIGLQTGLYNSAKFMNDMLNDAGINSEMEVVVDNNSIDAVVTKYKPKYAIIEALWVVPSKFAVLCKLHPDVTWIIRLHSEIPFLANEGMAIDWIGDYVGFENVLIAANAPRAYEEVKFILKSRYKWDDDKTNEKVIYLPNYFPPEYKTKELNKDKEVIDIGCFGAIRPLKNHLLQAIAAIKFAKSINKPLNFHINCGRIEMKGEPILRNLESLMMDMDNVALIKHEWMCREEFLDLSATMDIGMQCSLSETFNIVAADMISQGVPVIGSVEIPWMDSVFCANPVYMNQIHKALLMTYDSPNENIYNNQKLLTAYTDVSKDLWIKYFK